MPSGTVHINYCHAPTHYYWSRYEQYIKNPGFGAFNWLARFGLKVLVKPMQKWDYAAAQKPHVMVANSTHIAAEIKKYYDRTAHVVHPPVDVAQFMAGKNKQPRKGFIIAGRMTPYKRFDLAIAACTQLDVPLTVVGDGPERAALQKLAGPNVTFTGICSQKELVSLLCSAEAFVFPGLDDFGITPIEAMAAGCPVIAYKAGGALDYIVPNKTGVFFEHQTVVSLMGAIEASTKLRFSEKTIQAASLAFAPEEFSRKMRAVVRSSLVK